MAEEVLVKEAISSEMISAGAELADSLNKSQRPFDALLWLYLPEMNAWRFVVGSPEVKTSGPRGIYQAIRTVVTNIPGGKPIVPVDDIVVVDSNDRLISLLRRAIKTGQGLTGIRFTRNVINGVLIDDAYIYKLA